MVAVLRDLLAIAGGHRFRRQTCRCQVVHAGVLRLEHDAALGSVGDFQHETTAIVCRDAKVLVAFAGELNRATGDAEALERDVLGIRKSQSRRGRERGHFGGHPLPIFS